MKHMKIIGKPVTIQQALEKVLDHQPARRFLQMPLSDASEQTLATDVVAPHDYPPFDRAMLDGYALRRSEGRMQLRILSSEPTGAGHESQPLAPGHAARVMTGAPVPHGADLVIGFEDADLTNPGYVQFSNVPDGPAISRQGCEAGKGDTLLSKGSRLTPAALGVLASCGITHASVISPPIVDIICTGDELVEPDQIAQGPQIRNSNGTTLMALVRSLGCQIRYRGIVSDNFDSIQNLVTQSVNAPDRCDLLILTGGASAGDYDHVPDVLESTGFAIQFRAVKMKPGKPVSFGVHGSLAAFGLSGNPVSSYLQFQMLVAPLLRSWLGQEPCPGRSAIIENDLQWQDSGRTQILPMKGYATGILAEVPLQGSADLIGLARADCFVIAPENRTYMKAGEKAHARPL
jgi:molybdopterin molybdotransferase